MRTAESIGPGSSGRLFCIKPTNPIAAEKTLMTLNILTAMARFRI